MNDLGSFRVAFVPCLIMIVAGTLALMPELSAIGPRFTPEQMHQLATHVVTGKAQAIYKRTKTEGDWSYTYYIVEIRAEGSEKGEEIQKGDLLYVRCWSRRWVGERRIPTSGMGVSKLPAEGDPIRVYLEADPKNRRIFQLVGEYGFEELTEINHNE